MRNPSQRNCGSLSDRKRLCRDTHQTCFYLTPAQFQFHMDVFFDLLSPVDSCRSNNLLWSLFPGSEIRHISHGNISAVLKKKSPKICVLETARLSQSLLCVTSNPQGIVGIQNRLQAKKKKHDHCFLISCLEIA